MRPIAFLSQPGFRKGRIRQSKQVNDRNKAAGALLGAIGALKDDAARSLAEELAGELRPGETLPDYELSLELVARRLAAVAERMVAADEAYLRQSMRRKKLREACEIVARQELHAAMVQVRRLIDTAFGREAGRQIHGLEGKTLRKPGRVLDQARDMIGALEHEAIPLPAPRSKGIVTDREAWLAEVVPPFSKLERMMTRELPQLAAAEEIACRQRDAEMVRFDLAYGKGLRYVEAVWRLAGFEGKVCRNLRSYEQRRKLSRWAHAKQRARAAARELAGRTAGSAATVSSWWPWRRSA